jgi:hypothetical protein
VNNVVTNLRTQLQFAHNWLEGTLSGVDDTLANQISHGGKVATIGANYAHVIAAEDYFVNVLLTGGMPLMMRMNSGISEPPPPGMWLEWGHNVKTDLGALCPYAQAVYESVDAYLVTLSDADLERATETPVGPMSLGAFIGLWILNAHCHAGEISCLKGLRGLQGYPV